MGNLASMTRTSSTQARRRPHQAISVDPAAAKQDPRWSHVASRDASADGRFVYAVQSTGIYCRPSCPARRPRPGNVRFFNTCAEAEAAGFRPCRRCCPNGPSRAQAQAERIERVCRLIEASEQWPGLDALAAAAGMSPAHFQRQFKASMGLTPKAYAAAHRASRLRHGLAEPGGSVTGAIYAAGFNSGSRCYAQSNAVLGMTPAAYQRGGRGVDIRFAVGQCSLGAILVACSERGICAIRLGDDPEPLVRQLQDDFPNASLVGADAEFERLVAQVVGLVQAPQTGLDLPLDIRGTAFQQRVWQALRQIPSGQTIGYAELAERIGRPGSARAVARACAANGIAVAIPCHRVVRSDGALSGYRWGMARKQALLTHEAHMAGRQQEPSNTGDSSRAACPGDGEASEATGKPRRRPDLPCASASPAVKRAGAFNPPCPPTDRRSG